MRNGYNDTRFAFGCGEISDKWQNDSMKAIFDFTAVETTQAGWFPGGWHNRAFQYGDGLFETMVLQDGVIRFFADHFQRLTLGMQALDMVLPAGFTAGYLQNSIFQLAQTGGLGGNARLRLQVWRKPGGLYTPDSREAGFLLTAQPLVPPTVSVKENVVFYGDVRLVHSAISGFKTTSALPYVMAGIARKKAAADDAILLDVHGHVSECVASNLFWIKDGTVFTPGLESGCVAGIMRKNSIFRMRQTSVPVQEGLFTKADLLAADAVFCCNVAGIQLIKTIEGRIFRGGLPAWVYALLH